MAEDWWERLSRDDSASRQWKRMQGDRAARKFLSESDWSSADRAGRQYLSERARRIAEEHGHEDWSH